MDYNRVLKALAFLMISCISPLSSDSTFKLHSSSVRNIKRPQTRLIGDKGIVTSPRFRGASPLNSSYLFLPSLGYPNLDTPASLFFFSFLDSICIPKYVAPSSSRCPHPCVPSIVHGDATRSQDSPLHPRPSERRTAPDNSVIRR